MRRSWELCCRKTKTAVYPGWDGLRLRKCQVGTERLVDRSWATRKWRSEIHALKTAGLWRLGDVLAGHTAAAVGLRRDPLVS